MAKAASKKSPTKAETKAALDAAAPPSETSAKTEQVDTSDVKEAEPAATQNNTAPIFVFDELLDICRFVSKGFADQAVKESDRDFMLRVFTTISDMPEDGSFEKMQEKTQTWYNQAAAAESDGKSWDMPEGFTSKFGKGADKALKAAAESKAPKADKPPKAAAVSKPPKPPGIVARARRLVLLNQKANLAALMALAKTQGLADIKQPTMAAVFADTHATIGLAIELGMWKTN